MWLSHTEGTGQGGDWFKPLRAHTGTPQPWRDDSAEVRACRPAARHRRLGRPCPHLRGVGPPTAVHAEPALHSRVRGGAGPHGRRRSALYGAPQGDACPGDGSHSSVPRGDVPRGDHVHARLCGRSASPAWRCRICLRGHADSVPGEHGIREPEGARGSRACRTPGIHFTLSITSSGGDEIMAVDLVTCQYGYSHQVRSPRCPGRAAIAVAACPTCATGSS